MEAVEDRVCAAFARASSGHAVQVLARAGCDVSGILRAAARDAAAEPDLPILQPSWLTTEQVAEFLGVTPGTVARACQPGGELAHIAWQEGRRGTWRIDTEGLCRIMAERPYERRINAGQEPNEAV